MNNRAINLKTDVSSNTYFTPICATPICATPACATLNPVAPWAPPRIQRTNANNIFATNLSADFEDASSQDQDEDDLVQCMSALAFPDVGNYNRDMNFMIPDDEDEDEDYFKYSADAYTLEAYALHPNVTLFRGNNPDADYDSLFMDLVEDEIPEPSAAFAMEVDDAPHPNVTLFRGNNPDSEEDDSIFMDPFEEESNREVEEERKKETKKQKCGPTFKYVEMNYRDTQGTYPKPCAMCNKSVKYTDVYDTSCGHALCCSCYYFHEDHSAERCEILRGGYLSCPVRSCRKTIKNITGYTERKDEELFLDDCPMVYCKETGYWTADTTHKK